MSLSDNVDFTIRRLEGVTMLIPMSPRAQKWSRETKPTDSVTPNAVVVKNDDASELVKQLKKDGFVVA